MLPLAVLLGVWFLLRYDVRETAMRLLPLAVVALAMVAPWMVRNYAQLHAVVPMSTSMGANFWQGNSALTLPMLRAGYDVQWTAPNLTTADRHSPEADAARFRLALDYLREHPEQIPDLLWMKFRVHWSLDVAPQRNPPPGSELAADMRDVAAVTAKAAGRLSVQGPMPSDTVAQYSTPLFDRIGRQVHRLYWGSLLVLGVAGMVLASRAWRRVALLYFVQASMTAVYVAFHPSTRYRAATDPLFFLFSAFALVWLWRRARASLGPGGVG